MNDDRLLLEMRRWLQEEGVTLPDAEEAARRIATQLPTTKRRRRRWWRLPFLVRTPEPPAARDTIGYQPDPIPATNGHSPTIIGRTTIMLSPAKAALAGALVFAAAGVIFIAEPFGQHATTGPGASTDTQAEGAVWVTGSLSLAPGCTDPTIESAALEDPIHERDYRCEPQYWRTSDPRLTGSATSMWSADVYRMDGGYISVRAGTYDVRNDAGGWLCHHNGVAQGIGIYAFPDLGETLTCLGDGDYEGLSAVLELDWSSTSPVKIQGLIFAGEVPPFPEPPAE